MENLPLNGIVNMFALQMENAWKSRKSLQKDRNLSANNLKSYLVRFSFDLQKVLLYPIPEICMG